MDNFQLAQVITAAIGVVVIAIKGRLLGRMRQWASDVRKRRAHGHGRHPLLTDAELRFYVELLRSLRKELVIAPKVRVMDLLPPRHTFRTAPPWELASRHVDFALIHPSTTAVCLAIELDDASHEAPDRHERDELVDLALCSAGIPVLRIAVMPRYGSGWLRRAIYDALNQA